jgi:hypothetical protein
MQQSSTHDKGKSCLLDCCDCLLVPCVYAGCAVSYLESVGCELQICITETPHEMKVQVKPAGLCFNSGQALAQRHT